MVLLMYTYSSEKCFCAYQHIGGTFAAMQLQVSSHTQQLNSICRCVANFILSCWSVLSRMQTFIEAPLNPARATISLDNGLLADIDTVDTDAGVRWGRGNTHSLRGRENATDEIRYDSKYS